MCFMLRKYARLVQNPDASSASRTSIKATPPAVAAAGDAVSDVTTDVSLAQSVTE